MCMQPVKILRTHPENPSFQALVLKLDKDLAISDGEEHSFYNQFNGLETIKHAIVLYIGDVPVSIGALKEYDHSTMEIKRMYTDPSYRRKNLASKILLELETWAADLGYHRCILETGKRQPAAIALYKKNGYSIIKNYGQYAGKDNSVCFEKAAT